MQLQFSNKTVRYLDIPVQEVKNVEITQELRLTEGMPDIGRILMTWGQVMLRSKQWQSREIGLSGGVKLWVLYLPEDGTEPRVTEGWLPFQLKWDVRDTDREGPVRMMPLLRFADSRSISARKMMLRAGVGVLAQGFCQAEQEIGEPQDAPADVQIRKRTYPVMLPVEAGEKTFLLDEDLDLAAQGISADKMISCTVSPEVTEKRILSNKIAYKGCAGVHLVVRNSEGRIESRNIDLPFSQLVELDQTYGQDAQADIRFGVTELDTDMPENGPMRIKCGMVAQYLVNDRQILEVADDAYSPRRCIDFEMAQLNLPVIVEDKAETIRTEQMITGQQGTVADITFCPDYPLAQRNPGGIELKMSGLYQLLFYGEDGSMQSTSSRWEDDLQIPADHSIHTNVMVNAVGRPMVQTAVDGTSVSCPMMIQMQTGTDQGIPMMVSMEMDSQPSRNPDRPALILRRAGQDSLWEIAKKSGSTVDAVRNANHLTDEPKQEQMLLIPVC